MARKPAAKSKTHRKHRSKRQTAKAAGPGRKGGPSPAAIRRELARILSSVEFHASDRSRAFLRFVVEETLAGHSDSIKGYTIATRVFGRDSDFNPLIDPIVRIQAGKLRRGIERYYLTAGKEDPVAITIPKGTYVPTFSKRADVESAPDSIPGVPQAHRAGLWPSLEVRSFQNLTGDPEMEYVTVGLATELAMELTRFQDIRVLLKGPGSGGAEASNVQARFTMEGSVRRDRSGIKVAVQLSDRSTGEQLWCDTHRSRLDAARMIAFQEKVARIVAAKIASEAGIIVRTLSLESRNVPPAETQTYEAILRYYEFNATFAPQAYLTAFEALTHAAEIEPDCGRVWTMLGRLYAVNHSLELMDLPTPLDEAIKFGEKGVRLDPASQMARIVLAYVQLFSNDLPEGVREVEQALALNPESLIFLDYFGYLLTLLGDWERGPAMIRKAIELNPYHDESAYYGLWADSVRRHEYEEALSAALRLRRQQLFWNPLCRATSLALLGRIDEGRRAVEELHKLKPDFRKRGRTLIDHYVKFEEVSERILRGLAKVGVEVE